MCSLRESIRVSHGCKPHNAQAGVALIELALVLPLLLFILVGLIDIGLPISQQDVILDATRHVGENLSTVSLSNSSLPCEELADLDQGLFGSYLQRSGLNPADWIVEAGISTQAEDGYEVQIVNVIARSNPERQSCWFCFGSNWRIFRVRAESSFTLLGGCSED